MSRAVTYGNTFTNTSNQTGASRIPIWISKDEILPGGAYLPKSESDPEGKEYPSGTFISVPKSGGTPTLGGAPPTDEELAAGVNAGLTVADSIMGSDGCTFGIVTKGNILIDRLPDLTTEQKTFLAKHGFTLTKEL